MSDLQFADFRIDQSRRQLRRGDEPIPLPAKAFDLLTYMAANPGRLLPKSELLSAVWPDAFVEESNLTQNVFILRRVLRQGAEDAILTVPGRGYQFTTPVAEVPHHPLLTKDPPPSALEVTLVATKARVVFEEETEERISLRGSPLALTFVGVGVLAVAAAGWLGWHRWEDRVGGPPVQAVLADFEGSTGDVVLDRTLKDVLRFELGQSPFVTVVPRTTVQVLMQQMRLKPTDPLTADAARDLCERTGSQAVLHGNLARIGSGYVVTEEATNCVDGTTLGTAKQEVSRSEDLPRAIDRIGGSLRHDLGESHRTIARFNKPLSSQETGSLKALEDFSQSYYLGSSGRMPEAIELLKQAVALDQQFAAAYFNLSVFTGGIPDPVSARAYLQRAYEVREYATEPTRLTITAFYESDITGDLYASLRTYRTWISTYPRSPSAWDGLALILGRLGRLQEAEEAAKHHLELAPDGVASYQLFISAQIANGDLTGARKTCDLALSKGYDVELIRERMLELAHLTSDASLLAAQERWGDEHPDAPLFFAIEAAFAVQAGRIAESQQLLDRMDKAFAQQGTPTAGLRLRQMSARAYFELDEPALARKQLAMGPVDPNDPDHLIALAEAGQTDIAAAMLRDQLASHPQSTLWNQRYAPQVRAKMAMVDHKPEQAVALLQPIATADGPDTDSLFLLGEAYMRAGHLPEAEVQFRRLLVHRGIEAPAFQLPLAQLHLARVLAQEGKTAEALDSYTALLHGWSHADKELLPYEEAMSELAVLQRRLQASGK